MVDVARLGLAVDSSQVEKGTATLHQLTGAAGQASAAAQRLAGATNVEAAGHKAAAAAAQAHNAALMAQNTVIRSSMQQRTMMIYQLNDVAVSLASGMNPAMVAMQQGSQILQGGFAPALRTIADLAKAAVVALWPIAAAVGAVSAVVAGLTYEINKTAETQVGFFDVALAGWQLFADDVAASVAPVLQSLGSWLQQGWDAAAPVLKDIGNAIIGTSNAISIVWQTWPAVMAEAIIETVNVALAGITRLLNESRAQLAQFLSVVSTLPIPGVNALAGASIGLLKDEITAPKFSNPYAGAGGTVGGAIAGVMGRDYLGEAFGGLSERAQQIGLARAEAEKLGGAADAANGKVAKLLDQGLGNLTHWTESFGKAAQSAFSNLGTGIVQAFKKGGDVASNVLEMLMDKVGQFGETLLNNGLNGLLNAGLSALGGMFGGGTWGQFGGFSGFAGSFGIPGMASGGTVGRGGLSWVGEQGPELLRLPQGAQVIPNGPSMAMAANSNASMGDLIINNVINVPAGTSADVAPAIAREVAKELRKQIPDAIQSYNRNPLRRAS